MTSSIKKIAVIGTGVIGAGWTLRFLAKNKIVFVFDPRTKQKQFLLNEIKRTRKSIKKFYKISNLPINKLHFSSSIKEAVKNADLIQENIGGGLSKSQKMLADKLSGITLGMFSIIPPPVICAQAFKLFKLF